MSVATARKGSGLKLGAEPRKLMILGGLVLVAAVTYLYNSGGDTSAPSTSGTRPVTTAAPSSPSAAPTRARRRVNRSADKNTLRMRVVTLEAQRGNIDPTLRLDLLKRLQSVTLAGAGRNLFTTAAPAEVLTAKPTRIMPGKLPGQQIAGSVAPVAAPGPPPPAPIPLKFYGFAAPANGAGGVRRGFFMDGDNVVVASEGDLVKGRYRIVSLEPQAAMVQDTLAKNQQSLTITPEDK